MLLPFYLDSFSHTSHADFVFMWGVSLTQPVLASFLSGEFLLHIPPWRRFDLGSFSYTSRAGFIFMSGASLTHPVLALILSANLSYISHVGFIFIGGVSLTHPMLVLFLCEEFLLHIPYWLDFCVCVGGGGG